MNFAEAEKLFATARDPEAGKPLPGKATRLFKRDDDTYAVRYWRTDVVTIHRDGSYTLSTGGWETLTTRKKIAEFGPRGLRISSHQCELRIWHPEDWDVSRSIPIGRSLRINANGTPEHGWPNGKHFRPATTDGESLRSAFAA